MASLSPNVERMLTTDAAVRHCDMCYGMLMGRSVAVAITHHNLEAKMQHANSMLSFILRAGCGSPGSPDPTMREFCFIMLRYHTFFYLDVHAQSPNFNWGLLGEKGEHCLAALTAYDYEKHHFRSVELVNNDPVIGTVGIDLPLALHWGAMNEVYASFDRTVGDTIPRMLAEPYHSPQAGVNKMWGASFIWPYILGKGQQMAAVIEQLVGGTWASIEKFCDAFTDDEANNAFFAPRGQAATGTWICGMDTWCWCIKFNLAACAGEGAVSRRELAGSLPTPQQLAGYGLKSPQTLGGDTDGNPSLMCGLGPHLLAAVVCEKYDMHDEALAFAAAVRDLDPDRGGDSRPSSLTLGCCVRGRVMAQRGELRAAAAAFEEAVALSEKVGFWLLAVFALRDLKLCVLDATGHGDHGSRRLGAALRRLTGTADTLTPLLEGLDAAELMSLAPPDACHRVISDPEDPATAALRRELAGLRLTALQQRAVAEGLAPAALEDAMDSEAPKGALVSLLLSRQVEAARDGGAAELAKLAKLRAELGGLRLSALQKRAVSEGVGAVALEDAVDSADPNEALLNLILRAAGGAPGR